MLQQEKGGRTKVGTNDNKIGTRIIIANARNEITTIVYKRKTELYGKKFPVKIPQKSIDEVAKIHNLLNNQKITKTLKTQRIATAKHHVLYGQGNGFPSPLLKLKMNFVI